MAGRRFDVNEFLTTAGEGRTMITCEPGTTIFSQNEVSTSIYYLQSGRAKETVVANGREAVLGMLESGRFFGITGALFERRPRPSSVTAVSALTVTEISQEAMRAALRNLQFNQFFLRYLAGQNSQAETEKAELLVSSTEQRLARRLLALAHVDTVGGPHPIPPEVTQETLGAMVGTQRAYINKLLGQFRAKGLIRYSLVGEIIVQPSLLAAVLHHKDISGG